MSRLRGGLDRGRGLWARFCAAALCAAMLTAPAQAAPVSLSGWTVETYNAEPNYWSVAADGSSATYTENTMPTVLTGGGDVLGSRISFDIRASGGIDDDHFGFVLGFDPGGVTGTASTDYLLFDWKKAPHTIGSGLSARGLAVSRVADATSYINYWTHTGGLTELARAATLGATGWAFSTSYSFDVLYTASRVQVWVNEVQQFDLVGRFSAGTFGFYNNSQPGVRYSDLDIAALQALPAVPLPASLPLLLAGLAGFGLIRRRRSAAEPV